MYNTTPSKKFSRVESYNLINIEELGYMQESELLDVLDKLNREHSSLHTASLKQKVEVDISYVQREVQLRRQRIKAHAEWSLRNPWNGQGQDDGELN